MAPRHRGGLTTLPQPPGSTVSCAGPRCGWLRGQGDWSQDSSATRRRAEAVASECDPDKDLLEGLSAGQTVERDCDSPRPWKVEGRQIRGSLVFRLTQILGLVMGPEPGSGQWSTPREPAHPCRPLPQHSPSARCWDCFCALSPHYTVSPPSLSSF